MHRKLAAIMFTDMQGYTALMREDEGTAINIRKRHRKVFEFLTKKFRGNIVQYFGDGTLSVFDSSVDAVECAFELQKAFLVEPMIPVRIGIHAGDIVFMDGDIIGDAVNIASRIESIATPGAVFFSSQVNDQLRSHKRFESKYLDVFHFKNVKEAIPVFALKNDKIKVPENPKVPGSIKWENSNSKRSDGNHPPIKARILRTGILISLSLVLTAFAYYYFKNSKGHIGTTGMGEKNSRSSIAILPVQNLTGIVQNNNLCESISDELLQQLSNTSKIGKVVPKSLLNDYFERGEPMKNLANTLGLRYILESALHYSDSLYSLDLRLIDPFQRTYLWSNRFMYISNTNYINKVQSIVKNQLAQKIEGDFKKRVDISKSEKITDNQNAYELLLKADSLTNKMNKQSFYQALPLYEKAVLLDPELSEGYMGLARVYIMGGLIWGVFNQDYAAKKTKEYLEKAMSLKPSLESLQFSLINRFFYEQDFKYVDENLSLVSIIPPFPDGAFYAVYCNIMGRFEESIRYTDKYVKRFPEAGNGFAQMIRSYFLSGQIKKTDSLMNLYDEKFKSDQFYMRDVAMVHLNMGNMNAFKKMNSILKKNFLDNASVHLYYDAIELTFDGAEQFKINERLEQMKQQYENGNAGSPAWFLAMYYLHTKDEDKAFEWLKKSHKQKEVEMVWFKTEYRLQPFRKAKDPRYMAIYQQMDWPN